MEYNIIYSMLKYTKLKIRSYIITLIQKVSFAKQVIGYKADNQTTIHKIKTKHKICLNTKTCKNGKKFK